jgi:DNA-binding MarR family transcriptional regulator
MSSQPDFMETLENWSRLYFFQSLTDFFNYLKHTELSLLQAYALTYLFFKGPIKISDLCEHMMVSPGAASQFVDRLEKLEMVERTEDPEDRRVRLIRVRGKGEKFVQENFRFSQSWLSEIPAEVDTDQIAQISDVLSMFMKSTGKSD